MSSPLSFVNLHMLQIGQTPIPGYRLEKFLGRGAFGEVWQSTSPGGTKSALKFLNLAQKQGRKEFRSIQRLKQIRHANLMPINAMWLLDQDGAVIPDEYLDSEVNLLPDTLHKTMEVGYLPPDVTPSVLVIAMPQAEQNLLELLKQHQHAGHKALPVHDLLDYMRDAAKAIDFLNSPRHDLGEGVVAFQHGDVKPENMMLMGGSVLLCDFGVAKALGDNTEMRSTSMGGSLAYIAPECLDGKHSNYSDQFSLAMSYLELRTGELPFEAFSTQHVIQDRLKGNIDLSKVPAAEAKVLQRALSVRPESRFRTSLEFIDAIRAAASAEPARRSKRSPAIIVALGLIVASLAAIPFVISSNQDTLQGSSQGSSSPEVSNVETQQPDQQPIELPKDGQEEYRQALELIAQRDLSSEQISEATSLYANALRAGLSPNLPSPKISTLKTFYRGQARTELGSVFAIQSDGSKIAWVDGDANFVRISDGWQSGGSTLLKMPGPVMHMSWLDSSTLAVLASSPSQEAKQIYFCKDGAATFAADRVSAMACIGQQCYAIIEEKLFVVDATGPQRPVVIAEEESPNSILMECRGNDAAVAYQQFEATEIFAITRRGVLPSIPQVTDIELAFVIDAPQEAGQVSLPIVVMTTDTGEPLFEGIRNWNGKTWDQHEIEESSGGDAPMLSRARSICGHYNAISQAPEIAIGHIDGSISVWAANNRKWIQKEYYTNAGEIPVTAIEMFSHGLDQQWLVYGGQDGSIHLLERDRDGGPGRNHVTIGSFSQSTSSTSGDSGSENLMDEPTLLHMDNQHLAVQFHDGLIAVWNIQHCLMVLEACKQAGVSVPIANPLSRRLLESF